MRLFLEFPSDEIAPISEIGGKAQSLMRLCAAGFPVPPGVALTTLFFDPWFERLRQTPDWLALERSRSEQLPKRCDELKSLAATLAFTEAQEEAIAQVRERLSANGPEILYAVRSSSPDEDLATASFAGGYETRLGVSLSKLESAVRACFLSSLDYRVFRYKQANRLDAFSPSIAIVIQMQIDSNAAGVGFSLNPVTNDYDEAVIDANWGLGETVVAGLATPDHFVVDKVSRSLLSREAGAKQTVHRLRPEGGTVARDNAADASGRSSVDDKIVLEITAALCRVEALFGVPVDIEWAVADQRLFLLQARPITGFVPLPSELQTEPGERRRLYGDIALSSGLTINAPISTLGLDWMEKVMIAMFSPFIGAFELTREPRDSMWFFAGHRMYQDLSNMLWLASPEKMAKGSASADALMAETFLAIDRKRYRAAERPRWIGWRGAKVLPRLIWRLSGLAWVTLRALVRPEAAKKRLVVEVDSFRREVEAGLDLALPLTDFLERATQLLSKLVFRHVIPPLGAYLIAHGLVDKIVGKGDPGRLELAQKLKLGFKGNVVAEMGIALSELAGLLKNEKDIDPTNLLERFSRHQLSYTFYEKWAQFIERFGRRGPMEMDLAHPRYGDDPELALRLVSQMAAASSPLDPALAQERIISERQTAYRELLGAVGSLRRPALRWVYRLLDLFGETRDTPKHQNLLVFHAVRRRLVKEGERLRTLGKLDSPEHIFDLTLADLERADRESDLDLRALREERIVFKNQLHAHVRSFPGVIDSRGRILRPNPRPEKPGELRGTPISNGVATGPVKVLGTPDEKPIEPGDVLVAYTTDPGWTPLFVNAAAIVLEVGGVLQHGAVVAREYGKPCVAGIDRVTSRLKDGQLVEVNGSLGLVRVIENLDTDPKE